MSSGVSQLVSLGAQNTHLIGNPEISFFRSTHKRHTNFSIFTEELALEGSLSAGELNTLRIPKRGDMIGYVDLVAYDANDNPHQLNWHQVFDTAELYIGGRLIDTVTPEYCMTISPQLDSGVQRTLMLGADSNSPSFFCPLSFWFTRGNLYLPLVSLQYQEVNVNIRLKSSLSLGVTRITDINEPMSVNPVVKIKAIVQYVSLDNTERRQFTDFSRKFLITQMQQVNIPTDNPTVLNLSLKNPVKYIAALDVAANYDGSVASAWYSANSKVTFHVDGTPVNKPQTTLFDYCGMSRIVARIPLAHL